MKEEKEIIVTTSSVPTNLNKDDDITYSKRISKFLKICLEVSIIRNFFVIKAKSNENLAEVNVTKANFQLENALKGKPAKINELRDRNLLEGKDEEQSLGIRNIHKLYQVAVSVTEHETLNKISCN